MCVGYAGSRIIHIAAAFPDASGYPGPGLADLRAERRRGNRAPDSHASRMMWG